MRIELEKEQISNDLGIEIAVRGFQGDIGAVPAQVFVEYHDGKLRVHVWDGSSEDPVISREIPGVEPKTSWQCNGCNLADELTGNTCPNCGRTREESDAIR
jgi:hypothetical protein